MEPSKMLFVRLFAVTSLGLLFVSGCDLDLDYDGPKTAEIRATFKVHRPAFRELKTMLEEDRQCANDTMSLGVEVFEVGENEICGFYREETQFGLGENRWSNVGIEAPLVEDATREEVLKTVGLSRTRYQRYLVLLDTVHAKKAIIKTWKGRPDDIELYLGGKGWVTSSYYVSAVYLEDDPEPVVEDIFEYIKREGYGTYKVYSSLGDHWYVELDMQW